MTRSRLILAIRLATLAAVALWFGVPWYIVVPVSLMIPAFETLISCTYCTGGTGSARYQVDITSFADGSDPACSGLCSTFNGSWIYGGGTEIFGACLWGETPPPTRCCKTDNLVNFDLQFANAAGGEVILQWTDIHSIPVNRVAWISATGRGNPQDCNVTNLHLAVALVSLQNTCTVTDDAIVNSL